MIFVKTKKRKNTEGVKNETEFGLKARQKQEITLNFPTNFENHFVMSYIRCIFALFLEKIIYN